MHLGFGGTGRLHPLVKQVHYVFIIDDNILFHNNDDIMVEQHNDGNLFHIILHCPEGVSYCVILHRAYSIITRRVPV